MRIGIADMFVVALALLIASASAHLQADENHLTLPNWYLERF